LALGAVSIGAMAQSREAEPKSAATPGVHDMTQGNPRSHVVRLMWFILIGMAIQTLYALVDIYWVGRLGKEAVAAVALSSNLMFVSLALTQMLSVGCVALVSQAAGRKDHPEVQRLFNQAQSFATCAGFVFLGLGLVFERTYAERLSGDRATAELAVSFLGAYIPALALQFAIVGMGSSLRGIGDMKPGLVAQTASVLLNLVLAPFLVFGWISGRPLGVFGAALATLIASAAAVVGLVVYLARGKTFLRLRVADFRPDLATWKRMLAIGLPAGAEFFLLSLIMGTVYAVTGPFGAEAQAGYGIGSRLMQACFMPAVAISFAVAAVVGQNYGSRAFLRVRQTTLESVKLVLGFMIFFTLVCQLFASQLVSLFSSDPRVIDAGVGYLRVMSLGYFASGLVFVGAGVFQGLGNTWPSLLASGLRAVAFIVPVLALSRSPGFDLYTIWWISLGTVLGQLVLVQYLLRRELAARAPA
jgi:putative MATE family efflux protein